TIERTSPTISAAYSFCQTIPSPIQAHHTTVAQPSSKPKFIASYALLPFNHPAFIKRPRNLTIH
ncbi:MAG: hypothetical protein L6461_05600, partial [Anaerolineae bacterium]|nr:hypothetical protein [Anaerolineae bacterium]